MATKTEVIDLHIEHPDWCSRDIAEKLNCNSSYVRATASRAGLKLADGRFRRRPNLKANQQRVRRELGDIAFRAGLSEHDLREIIAGLDANRQP